LSAVPLLTLVYVGLKSTDWQPVMTPASWVIILFGVVVFPLLGYLAFREHLGALSNVQNGLVDIEARRSRSVSPPERMVSHGDAGRCERDVPGHPQHGRGAAESAGMASLEGAAGALKLDILGRLAGGLAREMDVPLQFINTNIRFQRDVLQGHYQAYQAAPCTRGDAPLGSPVGDRLWFEKTYKELQATLEENKSSAERLARIVDALREFTAVDGSEQSVTVDMNRFIESAVDISRHEWKHVANVITDLDAGLPVLTCRSGQIKQAILNLLLNSARAVAERQAAQGTGKGLIKITTWCDKGWVSVRIRDTGCGIREDIRPHIFHTPLTAQPSPLPAPQGLAATHAIITKQYGGILRCDSKANVGTTFTIRLPLKPVSSKSKERENPLYSEWRKHDERRRLAMV